MQTCLSNGKLRELVNSLCELQARIVKQIGPPTHFLQSQAASVEPLKTPIYVLRQMLGYAAPSSTSIQK